MKDPKAASGASRACRGAPAARDPASARESAPTQDGASLQQEVVFGRLRARILSMRSLSDAPDERFWTQGLRDLGVPADGVSLQFPGSAPGHYVVFRFEEGNYSEEIPLDRHPWIGRAWEGGRPVVVSPEDLEGSGLENMEDTYVVEAPLAGGGSLGINRRDGGTFDADLVGRIVAFADVVAEGVQRLRDFERLEESEARYRDLVEGLPIAVVHVCLEGRLLYANACARQILCLDAEAAGQVSMAELYVEPGDREVLVTALQAGGTPTFEHRLRTRDNRLIWVRGSCRLVSNRVSGRQEMHGFFEDVTEGKAMEAEYAQLEERLRQSQKMEAVGQLTAGIAHNFNNILQAISGNLQLALLDAGGELHDLLEDADRVTHRAAEMIRQLMVCARQGMHGPQEVLSLGAVVLNSIEICRRTFDPRIQVGADLVGEATVFGDAGLLQQVFLNLLLNAGDALEHVGDVEPRVRVSLQVTPGEGTAAGHVEVTVADNGPGMEAETRQRIFEPFFTTKPVDRGTGLGLAVVYGVITQHGGQVDCDSEPGAGTTFRVRLPLCAQGRPPAPSASVPQASGKATLLIVDDEELVRVTTGRLLEREGYRVLLADGGPAALEWIEAGGEAIDLVLLDLNMPGLSGHQVLDRLRQMRPELKVVIFTGHPDGEVDDTQADGVVRKPFVMAEVTQCIERLLGA